MRILTKGALLAAGVMAGATAARKLVSVREQAEDDRWLAVTVNLPPETVENDERLRERLANLGESVETRLNPAPGDRGTEVAARPRPPSPSGVAGVGARATGDDPRQAVRKALRETKSVLETGEVLLPDEPTTGKPTPGGALVRWATRRAGGEGRL